jgi:transposase
MTFTHTLGIDIAKTKFDAALHIARAAPVQAGANKYHLKDKTSIFANNEQGFQALRAWLDKHNIAVSSVHIAMEATGVYYQALAVFLCEHGFHVSVVNPSLISAHARAGFSRTKTDKADAKLIAHFCDAYAPAAWLAPAPHVSHLRELTRRLVDLKDLLGQETNRLEQARLTQASIQTIVDAIKGQIKLVQAAIKDHINQHPDLKEQADLLDTIPGLGTVTVATLLAEVEFAKFERAPKLAAFAGLVPSIKTSGTTLNRRGNLSKSGSTELRRSLYMPAVVAMQHNALIKTFYARLLSNGIPKMKAICACMRKLLSIAFGVLKSKQPFNPNYGLVA